MSRERVLIKNTMIITIGKICTQLITFLLLPLYTGILSIEEYGTVDLITTLVSLMLPLITLQLEQATFRNLLEIRDSEDKKNETISTVIFSVMFQCCIYMIIFFVFSIKINNKYKIFLLTNVISYIIASLHQQIARGLGENKEYAIGSFLSALATIIFNIIFIVFAKLGAKGMLLGIMLGHYTCSIYIILKLRIYKYCKLKFLRRDLLKKLLKYSIPLIPTAISWWVFEASDRIIVSSVLGIGQNGILSAAHKFPTLYISIYNIFNMSWTELISVHINDKDIEDFFNKTFNTMLKLFISLGIMIIACMPIVYPIMINKAYQNGLNQIPIMILGSIMHVITSLISVIYIAKKNTKSVASTSIVSAVINIFVHVLLINKLGLFAATISTFVAYFIMSIYRLKDVSKKYFIIKIEKKIIFCSIFMLLIILPIYYINNMVISIIGILIAIVFSVLFNKEIIIKFYKLICKKILVKKNKEI